MWWGRHQNNTSTLIVVYAAMGQCYSLGHMCSVLWYLDPSFPRLQMCRCKEQDPGDYLLVWAYCVIYLYIALCTVYCSVPEAIHRRCVDTHRGTIPYASSLMRRHDRYDVLPVYAGRHLSFGTWHCWCHTGSIRIGTASISSGSLVLYARWYGSILSTRVAVALV